MEFNYPSSFDLNACQLHSLNYVIRNFNHNNFTKHFSTHAKNNYIYRSNEILREWKNDCAYIYGDHVTYKNQIYKAKWWTCGDTPCQDVQNHWETPWQIIK
ncbi:carbohydrate-binding protein [Oceanirhabdus sp. W0125-5]|uniref:carbohydrate-binding protein n=1 Tax=Oceanirhabdus sp. W0125-5 TaxID=2999116 RepID=UPI0022F2E6C1|nr:carbohydrate-binding protein [Oceanirhabdus sp. W0125-5]WBW95516.1 hypothetical protein OW730_17705 [Oceanirhabdus sp. W0125-5]